MGARSTKRRGTVPGSWYHRRVNQAPNDALERVHRYIDARFDAHLERVRAFLRQPSVSAEDRGLHETADDAV